MTHQHGWIHWYPECSATTRENAIVAGAVTSAYEGDLRSRRNASSQRASPCARWSRGHEGAESGRSDSPQVCPCRHTRHRTPPKAGRLRDRKPIDHLPRYASQGEADHSVKHTSGGIWHSWPTLKLPTGRSINEFAQYIGVTCVPGSLLQKVHEHPAEIDV